MSSVSTISDRPPSPSLEAGSLLDRYELVCKLAEGGMAVVWVARQRGKHKFEKLVAVKTILPKYLDDGPFRTMFLDEARIAAGIEHTNVARILDLGEEGQSLYLVMEWVEGDSLANLGRSLAQQDKAFPPAIYLRVIADACAGLHAAHELVDEHGACLGVVHRDVSPQNILVSKEGHAKVIDFGVAQANDRLTEETAFGTIKGKLQYMAPEQARCQKVTRTADVYAVGAVLYRFFANRFVYAGANQAEVMTKLVTNAAIEPMPSDVPAPLRAVIMKAIANAPDDRYATMMELRAALEEAMVASGLQASTADVAGFVEELMGARLAARRDRVRAAIQAIDERAPVPEHTLAPSQRSLVAAGARSEVSSTSRVRVTSEVARATTDAHRTGTGVAPSPATGPAPRRKAWPAIAAGAAVIALGALVFGALRREVPQREAMTTEPTTAEPRTAVPKTAAPATGAQSAEPAVATAAAAPPPVNPTDATPTTTVKPTDATPTTTVAATVAPTAQATAAKSGATAKANATEAPSPPESAKPQTPVVVAAVSTPSAPTAAPPTPPPVATPASPPPPVVAPVVPPFDPSHARASVSGVQGERGVRRRDLQTAVSRSVPAMTQCYQAELARLGRAAGGQGTIRVETDLGGRIVKAHATVGFSPAVARCVERTVVGVTVPGVDTGDAEGNVMVSFDP